MGLLGALSPFYLITLDFEGDLAPYLAALERSLQHGVRLVQLRSKQLQPEAYKKLAKEVSRLVHAYRGKLILNGAVDLVREVAAEGVHLPSAQYATLQKRPIPSGSILSVACHDLEQVQHAARIQADIALVSPLFSTPSSPRGIPLGWEQFAHMIQGAPFLIYALGGLGVEDYPQARAFGAHGIAAKRALWNLQAPIQLFSA